MVFSTILLNLVGAYAIADHERDELNNFKQSNLYTNEYRECAKGHFSTKLFGEPLNCINDNFLALSIGLVGGAHAEVASPDFTHIIRSIRFEDELVRRTTITSNSKGQVFRIQAELNKQLTPSEMRAIANKISTIHGEPDVTPPSPRLPIYGWVTLDGFEIRLFHDIGTQNNIFSITHQQSHQTLRKLEELIQKQP